MASIMSNFVKGEAIKALLDGATVKLALMATGFVYDIDTHDGYASVSASELATGNGYTAGGATMAGYAVAVDDVNDRSDATWNDAVWTAAGGSIGPAAGAVLYIDSHISKAIIGYIDFVTDLTAPDGAILTVNGITTRIT